MEMNRTGTVLVDDSTLFHILARRERNRQNRLGEAEKHLIQKVSRREVQQTLKGGSTTCPDPE